MKVLGTTLIALVTLICGCTKDKDREHQAAQSEPARTRYKHPLSTPGARFGSLPQNVQATVLSEAGTAEIEDVIKESIEGRIIYKIYFRDKEFFPPLFIGADGSVLHPDLTVAVPARQIASVTLKLADVPLSVSKAVQEHANNAEINAITKETWGDHVIYIVSFKDEAKNPKLYIVSDGTLLRRS